MQFQNDRDSVEREDSVGGFLADLGFDIVGDLVPDSLIGFIVLMVSIVGVLIVRSAMNE